MNPRTEKQAEAARRNGAKSRGPVSDEGRLRSAMNALKHGARAAGTALPGEDVSKHHELLDGLLAALKPENAAEMQIVERMKDVHVRLARLDRAEDTEAQRELQQRLSSAPEVLQLELITRCLVAVEALQATASDPPPNMTSVGFFVTGARSTIEFAEHVARSTGEELDGLLALRGKVGVLAEGAGQPMALKDLVPAAGRLAGALREAQKKAQDAVKVAEENETVFIAAQPTRTKRLLNSYRSQLLKQLQSLLSIYAQITALRAQPSPGLAGP